MSTLFAWAQRWQIPLAAIQDLQREITGELATDPAVAIAGESEAAVQVRVRLEASAKGCRLFRNNLGATYDQHGNFIRYGLANDSEQLNDKVKSGDLIGIRPVVITPAHVGVTVGQFMSREVKPSGWRYSGTPREIAQLKWAELIMALGGDACFANGPGSV